MRKVNQALSVLETRNKENVSIAISLKVINEGIKTNRKHLTIKKEVSFTWEFIGIVKRNSKILRYKCNTWVGSTIVKELSSEGHQQIKHMSQY